MIVRTLQVKPVTITSILLFTFLLNFVLVYCDKAEKEPEVTDIEKKLNIQLECDDKESSCKTDKLSLEAINELHHMIDDDQDGNVNQQESKGFLKEELQYSGGNDRIAIFHSNDSLISVDDLWKAWVKSEVYNWTVDEVVNWLEHHVRLPQYSVNFRANNIDGHSMPRIAVTKGSTLKNELGIKNGIHRQKISVQAMDLVLFGPPKDGHNVLKDILLILSTFFVVGMSWFAYSQNKKSKMQLERMFREMENLQKADDTLKDVQTKLNEAQELQQSVKQEKTQLEMKYQDEIQLAKKEAERLKVAREGSMEEISRLKLAEEELVQVRQALKRAEKEIERSQWLTPTALRNWLQLSHEIELDYFNRKKFLADDQLRRARDECEKMSKKRTGFLGSLRVATSSSMDEMDHQIEEARSALEEVKLFSDERLQRWHNIEQICGFPISSNPGKEKLIQILQIGPKIIPVELGFRNVDEGELDEDIPPGYLGAGYSMPATSVPLRPHNLPNSMGQMGSSNSLPRSRTPKTGQNRHSEESQHSDELSNNGIESPITDTSTPDKPVFSLESSSPETTGSDSKIQQQLVRQSYQSMKASQSMQVIGNSKHYSDTIGGLGYIQNQSIQQAQSLGKRSQSDANLEKLNKSTVLSNSHSVEDKCSKPKDKWGL